MSDFGQRFGTAVYKLYIKNKLHCHDFQQVASKGSAITISISVAPKSSSALSANREGSRFVGGVRDLFSRRSSVIDTLISLVGYAHSF